MMDYSRISCGLRSIEILLMPLLWKLNQLCIVAFVAWHFRRFKFSLGLGFIGLRSIVLLVLH